jgi:flagellar motility protein MotE (MotC chaperone)
MAVLPTFAVEGETKVNSDVPGKSSAPSCLVDELALEDVKKSKALNELRAKELQTRESELKVKEQALNEQLKKIEKIRDEINHSQLLKSEADEAKIQQLTDTILGMSPRTAAKVLSSVDEKLAITIMYRMDYAKLAKIMNLMDSASSSRLSEKMAGVSKKHSKGGKINDESSVARKSSGQELMGANSKRAGS